MGLLVLPTVEGAVATGVPASEGPQTTKLLFSFHTCILSPTHTLTLIVSHALFM